MVKSFFTNKATDRIYNYQIVSYVSTISCRFIVFSCSQVFPLPLLGGRAAIIQNSMFGV